MTIEQIIKIDYRTGEVDTSQSQATEKVEARVVSQKPTKLRMKLYKTSAKKKSSVIKKNQQGYSNIRNLGFTDA